MAKQGKTTSTKRVKAKKKFIEIEIPLLGDSAMALGTVETLVGKTIKLDLTRKLRGRSLDTSFTIREEDGNLVGYPKKMELTKQYIIRMMRKRVNYVEDSFSVNCKDIELIVKPFMITRKKVSRAIRQNLRKTAREFIVDYAKEVNYLDFCEEILYTDFQKKLSQKLKKIYPLSFCEIRVVETNKLKDADTTRKEKVKREEVEESVEEVVEDIEEEVIEEESSEEESGEEEASEEEKPKKKVGKIKE